MKLSREYLKIIILLSILVVLPQSLVASEVDAVKSSPHNSISWTDLTFKGSKFLTTITVKMQLTSIGQSSDDPYAMIGTESDDCSATENDSKLLSVKSSSKGMFSQDQYEEKIWFKEAGILPYKRIRLSNGNDPWVKNYCWEDKGVRRQKTLPGNPAEVKQSPTKWTQRTESFYAYPKDFTECGSISDPSLIFYILSNLGPGRQQNPYEICVFGRKQLHRLTIKQEKSSPVKVSYKTHSASHETSVEDQITLIVYSIKTEAIPTGNREPETFSLLGLHKDIRIYMDPKTQIPVRISGTNNSAGKIDLELQNARLN